jgi:hypothetical protein
LDIHNDEVFSTVVQEIFNQTTTLVLHPPESKVTSGRPVAVDAWLERGQNLMYSLIQPKWVWKRKPRESSGMGLQNTSLQGIELLDITRILKVEDTEGRVAKPSHCFVVKTIHNEAFCFEAPNARERDRLVYSLKLVIARFGAKVLVGDPQVYLEFFSIAEAGVPGQAPGPFREGVGKEEEGLLLLTESSDLDSVY